MLTQELMKGYNRKGGPKIVAFKIDLQKAYDTVNWCFLKRILVEFGFHDKMVHWIMQCVSTAGFTINVNGERVGYFKGGRGLREVLKLVHVCFADDLLVMCHGDTSSVEVIKRALDEFSASSSMLPNSSKSTVFFESLCDVERDANTNILPFATGKLPVRYLEVPLIAKRLSIKDYGSLIDTIRSKVNNWKNRSLWKASTHCCCIRVCKSIWEISFDSADSWGWKNLLTIRDLIMNNVRSIIGNGMDTSIWFDNWSSSGQLFQFLSHRDLYDARLKGDIKVNEMINNGQWKWQEEWYENFLMITNIVVLVLVDEIADRIIWRDRNGNDIKFSVHTAYNDMTIQHHVVSWWKLIWFLSDAEDIKHLLFLCPFSKDLWAKVRGVADIRCNHFDLMSIMQFLTHAGNGNNIRSIVRRIAFANIWQEMNGRIFREVKINCDEVFKNIVDKVKHRLLGLTIKDSPAVRDIESKWDISCRKFSSKKLQMSSLSIHS
ncbi:RNA-directed DNA polymerase, eukaryota, reverse transcriptase zinc-binding domain protein [Tanacetum coccineum]